MTRKRNSAPDRSEPRPSITIANNAAPERAFDRWLGRQLHEQFDAVADEHVPEDLLRLLAEADRQRR